MDDAACLLLLGVSAMSLVAAAQRGKSLLGSWLLRTTRLGRPTSQIKELGTFVFSGHLAVFDW
jgi:hypothetical protein